MQLQHVEGELAGSGQVALLILIPHLCPRRQHASAVLQRQRSGAGWLHACCAAPARKQLQHGGRVDVFPACVPQPCLDARYQGLEDLDNRGLHRDYQ